MVKNCGMFRTSQAIFYWLMDEPTLKARVKDFKKRGATKEKVRKVERAGVI